MKRSLFLLLGICVFAFYLRIASLATNPPGFYTDEASIGFNAYKILTSWRDEHGKFMPVFFEAFGEYKSPFAIYPVVPFIAIFGVSEFSVRLAQVAFGILDIVLIFFLAKVLWNGPVGLLSAFVLAISPWHVHMSRFIIESHNAYLATVLGGALFLVLAKKNSWQLKHLAVSAIFFGLAFYTYFATRVFTPLFLLGLLVIWRKGIAVLFKKNTKSALICLLLFILILLPFSVHLLSGKGFTRFRQVAFTKKENTVLSSLNLYLLHFDPKFVFILGDSDYPGQQTLRHSVTGMGLFYKWQLPFFILGLLFLIFGKKKEGNAKVLVILMLILYPLGTVVSDARTPYATRSIVGVIPYTLLTGLGFYKSFSKIHSMSFRGVFILLTVLVCGFYLNRYLDLYKAYANRAYGYSGFQYGAREVVRYFTREGSQYSVKVIDGGLDGVSAYLNFYSLGGCRGCFVSDPKGDDFTLKKLIAVSVDNMASFNARYKGNIVHKIYYPDGREAFYIFEATSKSNL